eukprot:TRINITY_DN12109_c0_g1_i1.p1 TRINITY_DN12109_c0_g1~~TRINITY_DN12109_c0_g1_i1.p1  ORF type:complete len:520 (+),score=146.06 TRINITY_DN12109_c0_g1_i1:36-1562(+)
MDDGSDDHASPELACVAGAAAQSPPQLQLQRRCCSVTPPPSPPCAPFSIGTARCRSVTPPTLQAARPRSSRVVPLFESNKPGVNEEMRSQIVQQLLASQLAFVDALNSCLKVYYEPLVAGLKAEKPVLSRDKLRPLLTYFRDVLKVHTQFCCELNAHVTAGGGAEDGGLLIIGAAFDTLVAGLPSICLYVGDFHIKMTMLDEVEKYPGFADFLKNAQQQYKDHTLRELLTLPMLRLQMYKDCVKDLIQTTPSNHPDALSLPNFLSAFSVVVTQATESVLAYEGCHKMVDVAKRLNTIVAGLNLMESHRRYVREGNLVKVCKTKNKRFLFILFNDILLWGRELPFAGFMLQKVLPLANVSAKVEPDCSLYNYAFSIRALDKSFIVCAAGKEERDAWIDDITAVGKQLRKWQQVIANIKAGKRGEEATRVSSQPPTPELTFTAPTLQQFQTVGRCSICMTGFVKVVKAKHHCKLCGKVVCDDCSKGRMQLPSKPDQRSRVCDPCFKCNSQ